MEISPLSAIKYQLWLQERGTMKLEDPASYEDCPLLDQILQPELPNIPKYLKLAALAHKTPNLVVEYSKVVSTVYEDQSVAISALPNLLHNARQHGCSVRNIKGLGVSVGVSSIAVTPIELKLLFGIYLAENDSVSQQDLLAFLSENRNGSQIDRSLQTYFDTKRMRTNLSRMRVYRNIPLTKGHVIDLKE